MTRPHRDLRRALIPMADPRHSTLPLQSVLGRDGRPVSLIRHQVDELLAVGIEEVALVVSGPVHALVEPVLRDYGDRVRYFWQDRPLGFGHALWCARDWVTEPVVVQVCDHLFLGPGSSGLSPVVEAWNLRRASICAVQRIRESEVPSVGVVSGRRAEETSDLYLLTHFLEKPSLTKAELMPHVPGLGSSEYLCSVGVFVFTPEFFAILGEVASLRDPGEGLRWLAPALTELMRRETLYGVELLGRRLNLEEPFGLLRAQVAMGLASPDREDVLALLLDESIRMDRGTR